MRVHLDSWRGPSRWRRGWRRAVFVAAVAVRLVMFFVPTHSEAASPAQEAVDSNATAISHVRIPQGAPLNMRREAAYLARALRVPIVADPSTQTIEIRTRQ